MKQHPLLLAALLAASTAAVADDAAADQKIIIVREGGAGHDGSAQDHRLLGGSMDGMQLAALGELGAPLVQEGNVLRMHVRLVKNAPYSAEMISEKSQNLADGNQISHKSSSMNYRDSAGRTRQEVRGANGETIVTIHDPVEGATIILNPQKKTARKIVLDKELARLGGEKARARIEQLRKDGKLPEGEHGGEQVMIAKRIQDKVQVRVERWRDGQGPDLSRIAPAIGAAFGDAQWSAKASTKDLGSREFDGVKAEGKLRSYEIPAGAVGNKNAIVVANETWVSPELQVTLYAKHSDPRSGERIHRLANLKRDEPAPALFAVPADYTVSTDAPLKKLQEKN